MQPQGINREDDYLSRWRRKPRQGLIKAMITLYRLALAPVQKPYRKGLLFTYNDGDFGANFVTERGCDAPSSKVERHIPDR